jgi:DNA-binding IclR family transcriptional regulator
MTKNDTRSIHKTTDTAIEVLDFIRRSNGATLGEIQERFDLSRSTLYTHINTFNRHGLVIRENGEYWPGLRFREFSESARWRKPSYQIVEATVEELAATTDAEVEFLVEEVGRVNLVFHSEDASHEQVRLYAHNTAAGKAILAEYDDERVDDIVDRWGLPAEAPNTITDREALHDRLAEVAERGYAYNDEECFEGYHGIGAAIEGLDGSVLGALTIGGPAYRVTEEALTNELSEALLGAVDDVEASIRSQREAIYTEYSNR